MKKIIPYFLIIWLVCCGAVFGLDLQAAKNKGLVGETQSGYIAAVKNSSEVNKLVKNINSQRKKQYEKIAQKNKTTLQAVEQLAGKKAIEKTPKGQFVKVGGKWQKK